MSLRDLLAAATPRPWEHGDVWARAGVLASVYGEGRCAFCNKMGEPVWVGQDDINGARMLAHKHYDPDPYEPDHLISGPDGLVAGNYDYESGGIVEAADAALIVALVNTADELLTVAEAARVVADQERPREALEADIQALRDALARLDATKEQT